MLCQRPRRPRPAQDAETAFAAGGAAIRVTVAINAQISVRRGSEMKSREIRRGAELSIMYFGLYFPDYYNYLEIIKI